MKPVMFFDGGRPLCQREVAHYRALDRKNRVSWIDISREARVLEEQGSSVVDQPALHVPGARLGQ